ncbi:hemK methyltransferase family member 2-like isoform X1 [Centruroides sculpturatus]|uniref:hemK methyltransferase family member 2-like isoform X1 n=1 Tax=Centruroides sculpturatus TaxID=218467 RepID=UPI000C6C99E5|nr:hemK methyltransferase family member 2-like isoform X1 [Centruroides sculpturatus]
MGKLETPDWSNVPTWMFNHVYEPAEDTFLLLDAIEHDLDKIKNLNPVICLEVGCGSGVVITAVAKALNNSALFIATDKNKYATEVTKITSKQNNTEIQIVRTDLVVGLHDRLQRKIDLILFNPPYVVTPSHEVGGESLSSSWAGGIKGREVIDRFIPYISDLLSENGLFYLVIIKQNDYMDIARIMKAYDFHCTVVLSRRSGCEHLSVLRFSRNLNEK